MTWVNFGYLTDNDNRMKRCQEHIDKTDHLCQDGQLIKMTKIKEVNKKYGNGSVKFSYSQKHLITPAIEHVDRYNWVDSAL